MPAFVLFYVPPAELCFRVHSAGSRASDFSCVSVPRLAQLRGAHHPSHSQAAVPREATQRQQLHADSGPPEEGHRPSSLRADPVWPGALLEEAPESPVRWLVSLRPFAVGPERGWLALRAEAGRLQIHSCDGQNPAAHPHCSQPRLRDREAGATDPLHGRRLVGAPRRGADPRAYVCVPPAVQRFCG